MESNNNNVKETNDEQLGCKEKEEEYKGIEGAVAKLKNELSNAKEKKFAEPIIRHLIARCQESPSLSDDVCQVNKNWEKCYKHIYAEARKVIHGSCGAIEDSVVYEWAEDYFHKEEKLQEEKKVQVAKKAKEEKTVQVEKTAKVEEKVQEEKKVRNIADIIRHRQKAEEKQLEGQMDLFSLLGM